MVSDIKLEQLTAKTLRQNSNSHKGVELWAKSINDFGNFGCQFSRATSAKKSSQHVRPCAEGDGAICSKNRKIVTYHGTNPNTRNGERLRSPSLIMAPAGTYFILGLVFWAFDEQRENITSMVLGTANDVIYILRERHMLV